MKKQNILKTSIFANEMPFVKGFTRIENGNYSFTIGYSDEIEEDIFSESEQYLSLICKLTPKAEFPKDVVISAKYPKVRGGELQTITRDIYGNLPDLPMDGMVAEITIDFIDYADINLSSKVRDCLRDNPVIYKKLFEIQKVSKTIPNYADNSIQKSNIIHTKTKAHHFGGKYYRGIKLSGIQPYLFYMGTGLQAKEYASLISAKELVQNNALKLEEGIDIETLSTLEDDIFNGKIEIEISGNVYKSVSAIKKTLISDIFQINFIRKEN